MDLRVTNEDCVFVCMLEVTLGSQLPNIQNIVVHEPRSVSGFISRAHLAHRISRERSEHPTRGCNQFSNARNIHA